jgi:DNA-directed RNA polymerase specialized sigma24 family protein
MKTTNTTVKMENWLDEHGKWTSDRLMYLSRTWSKYIDKEDLVASYRLRVFERIARGAQPPFVDQWFWSYLRDNSLTKRKDMSSESWVEKKSVAFPKGSMERVRVPIHAKGDSILMNECLKSLLGKKRRKDEVVRKIFNAYFVKEMTVDEIAREGRMKLETVSSQVKIYKKELREFLKD